MGATEEGAITPGAAGVPAKRVGGGGWARSERVEAVNLFDSRRYALPIRSAAFLNRRAESVLECARGQLCGGTGVNRLDPRLIQVILVVLLRLRGSPPGQIFLVLSPA